MAKQEIKKTTPSKGKPAIKLNKLVQELLDELAARKMSVTRFSREVPIKYDRIQKWKQEGTSPKSEDAAIIREWIDKGPVTRKGQPKQLPAAADASGAFSQKQLLDLYLIEKDKRLEDAEKRNQWLEKMHEKSLDRISNNTESIMNQLFQIGLHQKMEHEAMMSAMDKATSLPEGSTLQKAETLKAEFLKKTKHKQ